MSVKSGIHVQSVKSVLTNSVLNKPKFTLSVLSRNSILFIVCYYLISVLYGAILSKFKMLSVISGIHVLSVKSVMAQFLYFMCSFCLNLNVCSIWNSCWSCYVCFALVPVKPGMNIIAVKSVFASFLFCTDVFYRNLK